MASVNTLSCYTNAEEVGERTLQWWSVCLPRKWKSCSFPPVSPHQLQDGYSNNNGSSGSQQCVSQPATPGGALPVPSPLSPSPASLSSYHGDDSDSISSPPWPLKTPSSPVRSRNSNTIGEMDVCLLLVKSHKDADTFNYMMIWMKWSKIWLLSTNLILSEVNVVWMYFMVNTGCTGNKMQ